MNDKGYTITNQSHRCPKPDLPIGTHIVCNECGRKWEKSWFGWVRVESAQRFPGSARSCREQAEQEMGDTP